METRVSNNVSWIALQQAIFKSSFREALDNVGWTAEVQEPPRQEISLDKGRSLVETSGFF